MCFRVTDLRRDTQYSAGPLVSTCHSYVKTFAGKHVKSEFITVPLFLNLAVSFSFQSTIEDVLQKMINIFHKI